MHLGVPQHHLHGVHLTVLTLRWPLPILEPKGAHMDDILTMDEIRSRYAAAIDRVSFGLRGGGRSAELAGRIRAI